MTHPAHPGQYDPRPTPPSTPAWGPVAPSTESRPMRTLRTIAYVTTSIASITFLIVTIWATVKINQIQAAIDESPLGQLSSLTSSAPGGPSGLQQFCSTYPTATGC